MRATFLIWPTCFGDRDRSEFTNRLPAGGCIDFSSVPSTGTRVGEFDRLQFRLPMLPISGARRCGRGRVAMAAEFAASVGATEVDCQVSLGRLHDGAYWFWYTS